MPVSFGALRFNTDSNKLELYDGNQWTEIVASSPDSQTGGARGVFARGTDPTVSNVIDYITISTSGNSIDFGDTITNSFSNANANSMSSTTRGIFSNGFTSPVSGNVKEYVTISSTGNSIDFGDSTVKTEGYSACSSSTRGIGSGGFDRGGGFAYTNAIDYVTIATTGNAVDFGDLIAANGFSSSFSSSTRGIWAGGYSNPSPANNTIQYVTISSTGNATDFGDLTVSRGGGAGCSSSIRGINVGGGPSLSNVIDYITIATNGNAQDFGDLTIARRSLSVGVSSPTRGVFAGGGTPTITNTIDYVTIAALGNATDFGDILSACNGGQGFSNGHGGL